jgi:hypothetical protein
MKKIFLLIMLVVIVGCAGSSKEENNTRIAANETAFNAAQYIDYKVYNEHVEKDRFYIMLQGSDTEEMMDLEYEKFEEKVYILQAFQPALEKSPSEILSYLRYYLRLVENNNSATPVIIILAHGIEAEGAHCLTFAYQKIPTLDVYKMVSEVFRKEVEILNSACYAGDSQVEEIEKIFTPGSVVVTMSDDKQNFAFPLYEAMRFYITWHLVDNPGAEELLNLIEWVKYRHNKAGISVMQDITADAFKNDDPTIFVVGKRVYRRRDMLIELLGGQIDREAVYQRAGEFFTSLLYDAKIENGKQMLNHYIEIMETAINYEDIRMEDKPFCRLIASVIKRPRKLENLILDSDLLDYHLKWENQFIRTDFWIENQAKITISYSEGNRYLQFKFHNGKRFQIEIFNETETETEEGMRKTFWTEDQNEVKLKELRYKLDGYGYGYRTKNTQSFCIVDYLYSEGFLIRVGVYKSQPDIVKIATQDLSYMQPIRRLYEVSSEDMINQTLEIYAGDGQYEIAEEILLQKEG